MTKCDLLEHHLPRIRTPCLRPLLSSFVSTFLFLRVQNDRNLADNGFGGTERTPNFHFNNRNTENWQREHKEMRKENPHVTREEVEDEVCLPLLFLQEWESLGNNQRKRGGNWARLTMQEKSAVGLPFFIAEHHSQKPTPECLWRKWVWKQWHETKQIKWACEVGKGMKTILGNRVKYTSLSFLYSTFTRVGMSMLCSEKSEMKPWSMQRIQNGLSKQHLWHGEIWLLFHPDTINLFNTDKKSWKESESQFKTTQPIRNKLTLKSSTPTLKSHQNQTPSTVINRRGTDLRESRAYSSKIHQIPCSAISEWVDWWNWVCRNCSAHFLAGLCSLL